VKRRIVKWSAEAFRDLDAIVDFFGRDDPYAAEVQFDRIMAAGEKLGEFASGHAGRIFGVFEKRVTKTPYIIAYTLSPGNSDATLVIIRIIHSARNWPEEDWPE
jgi:toxin ParE1/3/4